jgi:hypothetical protein
MLFGHSGLDPESQPKNQTIQKKCLLRKKILDRDRMSGYGMNVYLLKPQPFFIETKSEFEDTFLKTSIFTFQRVFYNLQISEQRFNFSLTCNFVSPANEAK